MRIAVTGGTGFVGRHLARALSSGGQEVVLIARGIDHRDESVRELAHSRFCPIGTSDEEALVEAFSGCDGVAHCAGINREMGNQTYQRVHVEGTHNVVNAAKPAGIKKIVLLSFLRPTELGLGLPRVEMGGRRNRPVLGPRLHRA